MTSNDQLGNDQHEPHQYNGVTTIADPIVAKVAGLAARGVPGVHTMGDAGGNPFGRIRQAVGSTDYGHGVRVEVGSTEVAADVRLVAELGVELQKLCNQVREAVFTAVQNLVGKRVIEVNVEVADIHLPDGKENKERS